MDALRPSMLGTYGNTWFDTPALNRFAAGSLVYEQCTADTPDPVQGLANLVSGQHFCQPQRPKTSPMEAVDPGPTLLIASDTKCLPAIYDQFDRVIDVELPEGEELASDLETTQLAAFFASAIQEIQRIESESLIMLYCGSLATNWDAPYDIRMQLADEEDPDPSRNFRAVDEQFNERVDDPDQLLDFQIAYGAQVIVFDQLLEVFQNQIAANPVTRNSLVSLMSLRGYPLGEHGVVGFYRNQLFNESLHVPLMLHFPDGSHRGRSQRLVQTGSLFEFLAKWHGGKSASCFPELAVDSLWPDCTSEVVISGMESESQPHHSIQTHKWKLIRGNSKKLFVRPDDRWEYNDVAGLCSEISQKLEETLDICLRQLTANERLRIELSSDLAFGIE